MRFTLARLRRPRHDTNGDTPRAIPPDVLRRIRGIEIRARRLVDNLFLGEYHAVFRGRGIEFDDIRPYIAGDDVRAIDWKSFARTGEPTVRRYREERDLTVLFAVDVSASQAAGALPVTKADTAAELCAVLALAATRNKDRSGLLLFAAQPEKYVPPASGPAHVLRVVREVLWARPVSRGTDIGGALRYLSGVHRRRAIIFLVSDFLATGYESELRVAARRFDITAICVREPRDHELADAGIVSLVDAETGDLVEVDTSSAAVRDAYSDHVRRLDDERKRLFGELGIEEISVTVGEDYVRSLLAFFRKRALAAAS